jgi:uncharacterized protein YgbK (DUF1537 family)
MTIVRALADDLTGAIDAGAAFVGMCGPIAVSWRSADAPLTGSLVLDNEARSEADADRAARKTLRDLSVIDRADIAFKKIDSLMRGHTVTELQACIASKRFASMVLAPSFPYQGRVTRDAQQFARLSEGGRWQPVGPHLARAFDEPTRRVGAGDRAGGAGLFICDAETEDDMRSLPARLAEVEQPILWCGSAGLARAMASVPTAPSQWSRQPALVVVGTHHPISQAQVGALRSRTPDAICVVDGSASLGDLRDRLECRLAGGQSAVLTTGFDAIEPAAARCRFTRAINGILPFLPVPERLIVMGGETLLIVLDAVGALSAIVEGEIMPGVAIGRAVGGSWDGVTFASKSGAFGAPSLLRDLLIPSATETSS